MKKIIFYAIVGFGLLTACDPVVDKDNFSATTYTAQTLSDCFTFTQADENGNPTADGNYFTFSTSPATIVTVLTKDELGNEDILAKGNTTGSFKIVPRRGESTTQKFYVRVINSDGTTTDAEKTVTVYVPSELSKEMKLLASDSYGRKIWKWDTEFRADGGAWGNMGYACGSGDSFSNEGNGIWFACAPADLTGQLQHSDTGEVTGEEDPNAYMAFSDDGTLKTYSATGGEIRSGKFSVEGYTGNRDYASNDGSQQSWSYGTLKTTAGSILFPFKINGGGEKPTEFEIMQLDANHLKLIYVAEGTDSWGEATWWAFKSESDAEASLTDFASKSWTWDTEFRADGGTWGNMGYTPGNGDTFCTDGNGIWFACAPADLTGQLKHSDTGVATGEEDPNAYMTFNITDGTVTSFAGNGTQIRKGKFEISIWNMGNRMASSNGAAAEWNLGNLYTDAGSILFPFKINGGGTKPTEFEIMQLDANHLKLIYADEGTGGWSEATWWAFKAKK